MRLIKDDLGGKIMTECVVFKPKTYLCLTDDDINSKEERE